MDNKKETSGISRGDIETQIQLLMKWNHENINYDPEQVRKNVETVLNCYLSIQSPLERR